jgi:hypothetical protein
MSSRRLWLLILFATSVVAVIELQWARPIHWDEVEYFRATKWVAEGRVPFRDFWEHHLPLQWYLFAPVAALTGNSAGVASLLAMRWAQIPLWIAAFAFLFAILRRAGIARDRALAGLLVALASPLFVEFAIEYRLDTLATALYFAALWMVFRRPSVRAVWIAFGALMSAVVLANMRMMPLVVTTAVLLSFIAIEEQRWKWKPVSLWMSAGVLAAVSVFAIWLVATGTREPLWDAMRYNIVSNRMLAGQAHTFIPTLLLPFRQFDLGAIALMAAGIAGAIAALRTIHRPGVMQLVALLAFADVVFISRHGVHYPYHFQIAFLFAAMLAANIIRTDLVERLSMVVVAIAATVYIARLIPISDSMAYQSRVMTEVDRRTLANERVWDGCGYALRRAPAYRYWFLPAGVRMMAMRGMIEPYDVRQLAAAPPAAIVHTLRVNQWLRAFPEAGSYVTHHYLPLYRDLWIPGLSAAVPPRSRVTWIAPRGGTYRVYASEILAKHPWFTRPLDYAIDSGPGAAVYAFRIADLPPADPARMHLTVDGAPVSRTFALKKGSAVQLESAWETKTGVIIVPENVTELFAGPVSRGVM